jgi:secreted Zn-dependent insulinase-like peptidase
LSLIDDLLQHEGKGSLYSYLKKQELIEKIYSTQHNSYHSIMTQYYIELRLTDLGLQRFRHVTAILFGYIQRVRTLIADPESEFYLFEEIKKISHASFLHYNVNDPMDNVQTLADEMTVLGNHPDRYPKLLIDTYEDTIVEDINMPEVLDLMSQLTYSNAKVILSSKNLLKGGLLDSEIKLGPVQ